LSVGLLVIIFADLLVDDLLFLIVLLGMHKCLLDDFSTLIYSVICFCSSICRVR